MSAVLLDLAVPLILLLAGSAALYRRTDAFPALTRGAFDGLKTVAEMFPALCVLFPAVYMLRASGALEAFSALVAPLFRLCGIPPETAVTALLRPVSGSAATAAASQLIAERGADSLVGRTAAVMLGSSETTLYVVTVYFAAAKIRDTRWAIPAALCADLAVYLSSAWISRLLWG